MTCANPFLIAVIHREKTNSYSVEDKQARDEKRII